MDLPDLEWNEEFTGGRGGGGGGGGGGSDILSELLWLFEIEDWEGGSDGGGGGGGEWILLLFCSIFLEWGGGRTGEGDPFLTGDSGLSGVGEGLENEESLEFILSTFFCFNSPFCKESIVGVGSYKSRIWLLISLRFWLWENYSSN